MYGRGVHCAAHDARTRAASCLLFSVPDTTWTHTPVPDSNERGDKTHHMVCAHFKFTFIQVQNRPIILLHFLHADDTKPKDWTRFTHEQDEGVLAGNRIFLQQENTVMSKVTWRLVGPQSLFLPTPHYLDVPYLAGIFINRTVTAEFSHSRSRENRFTRPLGGILVLEIHSVLRREI